MGDHLIFKDREAKTASLEDLSMWTASLQVRLNEVRKTQVKGTQKKMSKIRYSTKNNSIKCAYLSLWSLLKAFQEWCYIIIIINSKLHFFPNNPNGNILLNENSKTEGLISCYCNPCVCCLLHFSNTMHKTFMAFHISQRAFRKMPELKLNILFM